MILYSSFREREVGDADPTPPTPYFGRLVDIPNTISVISSLLVAKYIIMVFQLQAIRINLVLEYTKEKRQPFVACEEKQLKDSKETATMCSKKNYCHKLVVPPDDISGENLHELFEPITNNECSRNTKAIQKECDQRNNLTAGS